MKSSSLYFSLVSFKGALTLTSLLMRYPYLHCVFKVLIMLVQDVNALRGSTTECIRDLDLTLVREVGRLFLGHF